MKTLVNTLFVAFALTFASFTVSQADINSPAGRPKKVAAFQTGMYTTTEGKLHVALQKEAGGSVVVRLTNQKGDALFVQEYGKREQAARLRLDVSDLPDGVYQLSITNGVETTTKTVTLASEKSNAPARFITLK
ncbi:T9SS type A sorting domain-containing protein [Larkinella sp. VNQ87]|uniref:T9SS type A sorting domain-containing protein n=1 Tax=Larkinella sp. VNQ87 TaxID=3400921 RepID=UPI003C11CF01